MIECDKAEQQQGLQTLEPVEIRRHLHRSAQAADKEINNRVTSKFRHGRYLVPWEPFVEEGSSYSQGTGSGDPLNIVNQRGAYIKF